MIWTFDSSKDTDLRIYRDSKTNEIKMRIVGPTHWPSEETLLHLSLTVTMEYTLTEEAVVKLYKELLHFAHQEVAEEMVNQRAISPSEPKEGLLCIYCGSPDVHDCSGTPVCSVCCGDLSFILAATTYAQPFLDGIIAYRLYGRPASPPDYYDRIRKASEQEGK